MQMSGIGWAVKQLRDGGRVRRAGWNGKGMFLFLVKSERNFKLDAGWVTRDSYVMMKTAQGSVIPWLCSQADLLANDWESAT